MSHAQPRFVRVAFTAASAASLVLCVVITGAWMLWDKQRLLGTLNNPALTSDAGFYVKLLVVHTPFWLGVLVTAFLPLLWLLSKALSLIEARRLDRIERNVCTACGYDLRGSPGQCPECGSVAPESPGSGA